MTSNLYKRYKVFISYSASDGIYFAIETNNILSNFGYKTWFYKHHRTIGNLPWEEISDVILKKTDIFIYLCTINSHSSRGQAFESEYAMTSNNLMPQIIIINGATCPQKLTIFNRENLMKAEFTGKMQNIARRLPKIISNTPFLDRSEKAEAIS